MYLQQLFKMGLRQSKPRKISRVVMAFPNVIGIAPTLGLVTTPEPVRHSPRDTSPRDTSPREPIRQTLRETVWLKYHGDVDWGVCYCCGGAIQRYHAGWHCAHVLAAAKGGKVELENLRTSCRHCNLSMGNQNLYEYIRKTGLNGPGAQNVHMYLGRHPSQLNDRRTNNWNKKGRKPTI